MADTDIAVTGLSVTAGYGELVAEWTFTNATSPLPYLKLNHFEVYVSAVNDRDAATHFSDQLDRRCRVAPLDVGDARYFWVRGVDVSGNAGDFFPLSATAGIPGIVTQATPPITPDDLGPTLQAMTDHFSVRLRDLDEQQMLATSLGADQDLANYSDKQFVLNQIVAKVNTATVDVTAAYTQAILLLASETEGALADVVEGVSTTYATKTALGDLEEAAETAIETSVLFRMTSYAGPGGGWARAGIETRASFGDVYSTAAAFFESKTTGESRIILKGGATYILDQFDNVIAAFESDGSLTYARIPVLQADKIDVDTITVDRLEIGARAITFEDISFEHNVTTVGGSASANNCAWTAGSVTYVDDAGTAQTVSISAGFVSWTTGTRYIYWAKGATAFASTTSAATAKQKGNVVVATYKGGKKLVVTWGKLIIDGSDASGLKGLSVAEQSIADGAVTDGTSVGGAGTTPSSTSFQTIYTISVPGSDFPTPIGAYLDWTTNNSTASPRTYDIIVDITVDGLVYVLGTSSVSIIDGTRTKIPVICAVIPPLPSGSYNARLRQKTTSGASVGNHTVNSATKLGIGRPKK